MRLSANFTLEELTRSGTADRYGLDNTPGAREAAALRDLVEQVLQPLRDRVGPLKVTSGFRSAVVNRHPSVGGSSRSQHTKGEAADVIPSRTSRDALLREVHELVKAGKLVVDQVITYDAKPHLHLSFRKLGPNRGEFLRCRGPNDYVPWRPEAA